MMPGPIPDKYANCVGSNKVPESTEDIIAFIRDSIKRTTDRMAQNSNPKMHEVYTKKLARNQEILRQLLQIQAEEEEDLV